MRSTTATAEVKHSVPDASRKARRSVVLALVHVGLVIGILALFVFLQSSR